MTRSKSNSFRPNCEALESREVPAIVIDGTFNGGGQAPTPNGNVNITEVQFATGGAAEGVVDKLITTFVPATKSASANDNIVLTLNGSTLTINSSDGIYVRTMVNGGDIRFVDFGNTIDISGVTGLNVNLQLGGNDSVTDNTTLGSTINGGIGNDTITVAGGAVNPLLLQLLMQPGGLNPALLPLLSQMSGPAKNISGGDGDDTITVNGFASMFMIDGGVGADRINGPTFGLFNQLKGGADNDIIIGGMGQDIIFGDAGVDILFGFGGNDFLISVDGGPDFVLNQPGDTVIPDPGLDVLSLKI